MEENNDSPFDNILLRNIDEEITIDINLLDTSAKNSRIQQSRNWKTILIKIMTKQQKVNIKRRFC